MGKLITVVGNSGVGKTAFSRLLCQAAPLVSGLEQHQERPFQLSFAEDHTRYGLHNQVDYLLFRAEQEVVLRKGDAIGVQDGGLELDFFVFTRLFYLRGYLTEAEYLLCKRLYTFIRRVLPPPDVILRLIAPLDVVSRRYALRNRSLEIARPDDLQQIEILLEDWLGGIQGIPVLSVDAALEDPTYSGQIAEILPQLNRLLNDKSFWPYLTKFSRRQ